MLRDRLSETLKTALKAKEARTVSTVRLILAALKDRDIAARSKGNQDGIDEADVLSLLQSMIKQRRDSIKLYEKGGRLELAQQEGEEIEVIETFLPEQLSDEDLASAVSTAITEVDATTLKDMGKTMAALKTKYAGQMDFSKASALVKTQLG
ncbi:MAG: GatB/YqeY domain-containing protein [Rhodospirillaceae bacterium]|jgi:hypothetical protein|nr:GatB/YqeY domain-containing protein [Rhodospirillales bacterium]MBT3904641.1 GatB/YqeY domain-containing protein [Rhodospirillaceae bacterium]MBT4702317.1 GatB/YqeY domain-containing protein [Rhodospirillaceae bacterium]MBT5036279.1 GatB/YqeY domain-containing protein [Rhodospirillaceae bacterium]MBT6222205.1 GatB/YqeY domain-containing protein [Rhodospirillaceae bacterium]